MKTRYIDLIDQTFDFPVAEFDTKAGDLTFDGVRLMDLVEEYGSPLRLTWLPSISRQINRSREIFENAISEQGYSGKYQYSYCTKGSHFGFILEKILSESVHLETSSPYDMLLVKRLFEKGWLPKDTYIICNGYKTSEYNELIIEMREDGFENIIVVFDSFSEIEDIIPRLKSKLKCGIRIASEEDPGLPFYTSRLGFAYKDIKRLYTEELEGVEQLELRMLHFFINTGITDTAYYWNELMKSLRVFGELAQICQSLDCMNIGGGFPVMNSLGFEFDYQYMVDEIIGQIKTTCAEYNVKEPDIFTEFGTYTVAPAGINIFSIIDQKKQNDREKWNMINGSFMTTLPDSWAMQKRFLLFPLNRWNDDYERCFLGGLTCDSEDYYNSEQHVNAIYLPKYEKSKPSYIAFFNTGAYQDSLSGYGGIKHCLSPSPRHVIVDRNEDGKIESRIFAEKQSSEDMFSILGV